MTDCYFNPVNWSWRRWSLSYLINRIRSSWWYFKNKDKPWFAPEAVAFLDGYLKSKDSVLEFGSGRSTFYFAGKCKSVLTVEDNKYWFNKIGVHFRIRAEYIPDSVDYNSRIGCGLFSVIVVDGCDRRAAAFFALEHLDAGGILIIDNADRFKHTWPEFWRCVYEWRRFEVTDNVTWTLILFKPTK